jgi:DNA-binding MarR family transcriptional regulator
MESVSNLSQGDSRHRGELNRAVRESLRELGIQLAQLNQRVSGRLDLRAADFDCLDLIERHGPLSPSVLARRTGLHPATMTGVLDRLERGDWIARERDPADRRSVIIRIRPDRGTEVLHLYSGMNAAMAQICGGYSDSELELVAGFLRRTAEAGRAAGEGLADR